MKTILVTGGAGFIGSNFLLSFSKKYPEYRLVNFDKLTYASDISQLSPLEDLPGYTFIQGDIADLRQVERAFSEYRVTDVIHFAAESHVDNSIRDPGIFMESNIKGTYNLLNVARSFWMQGPNAVNHGYAESRFHHISTDEVYGSLGDEGLFTEDSPYRPNSPYSASKASSDLIVRSYNKTYGLNAVITNCSNNYGPRQNKEKLIPTIIRTALAEQPIPVYGKGLNVRDWLFVGDHCQAIDTVFHKGIQGETYNVGGDCELRNIDLVQKVCKILDELTPRAARQPYSELISYVQDRPGHDFRYAVDFSRLKSQLGWTPLVKIDEGLLTTVRWYLEEGV